MGFSRRQRWGVHLLVVAVVFTAAACGREGGTGALPDRAQFCNVATKLATEAANNLAPLASGTSLAELARRLDTFLDEHRRDYALHDRLAPAEIKPALRRQRAAQQAFINADNDADRQRAYDVAVSNGRVISEYQNRNCS